MFQLQPEICFVFQLHFLKHRAVFIGGGPVRPPLNEHATNQEALVKTNTKTKGNKLACFPLAKVSRGLTQSSTVPIKSMAHSRKICSGQVPPKATAFQDDHIKVGQNMSKETKQEMTLVLEQATAMFVFHRIGTIHQQIRHKEEHNPHQ